MKTSRNDIFDLDLCIRALGNQLTYMHTDLYLFMYSMTFRSGKAASEKEFEDAMKDAAKNTSLFTNSRNAEVKICARIYCTIIKFKAELCSTWSIDEREDLGDQAVRDQAMKYGPRFTGTIKRRNYLKMGLSYSKTLGEFMDCLNAYQCAITIQSYKIPLEPEKQLILCDKHHLNLPIANEKIVYFINSLLGEIMEDIEKYQDRVEKTLSILGFLGGMKF